MYFTKYTNIISSYVYRNQLKWTGICLILKEEEDFPKHRRVVWKNSTDISKQYITSIS
jgi:hypothetical protein